MIQKRLPSSIRQPSITWPITQAITTQIKRGSCRAQLGVLLLLIASTQAGAATLDFDWRARFSATEQHQLRHWIQDTQSGLERLVGDTGLDTRLVFYRQSSASGPVPWAETIRSIPQGVRLYVDPRHGSERLYADWTAAHELSHLVLPYLGPESSWFAEGFASYMQYRVLHAMGRLSAEAAQDTYMSHVREARRDYPYPHRPFVQAAGSLRRTGLYSVMYWGGSVYFLRVDRALRTHQSSLDAVLREYLACCRRNDDRLGRLIETLDTLAGSPVFSTELHRLQHEPGFPRMPDSSGLSAAGQSENETKS